VSFTFYYVAHGWAYAVLCAFVGDYFSRVFVLFATIYPYSDAPALSTNNDAAVVASANVNGAGPETVNSSDAAEQWDDEAVVATLGQKKAVAANSAELLDMKSLDLKRSEQGDIQEKLRVEENKAKLAAAKAGMEKEAQRLKEEKGKKEQGGASTSTATSSRFGAAAAGIASSGGVKWLPPHMRAGGASLSSRMGMGGPGTKLDTEDENLFPDLAAADAILEKQKSHGPAYKVPKKTPVGGGATWGSKMKAANKKIQEAEPEQATKEKGPKVAESEETRAVAPSQATEEASPVEAAPAPAQAAAAQAPIKPKKKKKKDLSTFKAAS
jgi:hypothetical protein